MAIPKKGVHAWNDWRQHNPEVEPDLSEANFDGADLRNINLGGSRAPLLHERFIRRKDEIAIGLLVADVSTIPHWSVATCLYHADFTGANLSGADFRNSDMMWAHLTGTTVDGADFSGARLWFAEIAHTAVRGCKFHGATLGWTTFANVDLSSAVGLAEIMHIGPSTLGLDTLIRSGGRIADEFLRGTGLGDSLIDNYAQFASQGHCSSCFISFSPEDQDFAERLHADLQKNGVRCWFAPHNIKGGRKIEEQIREAIRLYDRLLIILSEHSMNSEWVRTEITHARQKEINEGRRVLFPISVVPFERIRNWTWFDADTGRDWAREIREYFIPDFCNWKNDASYRVATERLIADLKPSGLRNAATGDRP